MNNSFGYNVNQTQFKGNSVNVFMFSFSCAISLCSVLFNSCLISVILKTRILHTYTNFFIISLAVSELIAGVFWVPFIAVTRLQGSWAFGDTLCGFSALAGNLSFVTEMLTLMMITIDRCVAVWKPLKYTNIVNLKSTFAMLSYVWLHGFVVCLLPFRVWGGYEYNSQIAGCSHSFTVQPKYVIMKEFVSTWIPAIVIFILVWKIVQEARSRHLVFAIASLPIALGGVPASSTYGRNTMKAMKSLIFILCAHTLFWLPYSVVIFVKASGGLYIPSKAETFSMMLSQLCCVDTPIIIMSFNKKFKQSFVEMFCVLCTRVHRIHPLSVHFTVTTGLLTVVESSMVMKIGRNIRTFPVRTRAPGTGRVTLPMASSGGSMSASFLDKRVLRKSQSTPVFARPLHAPI